MLGPGGGQEDRLLMRPRHARTLEQQDAWEIGSNILVFEVSKLRNIILTRHMECSKERRPPSPPRVSKKS